MVLANVRGSDAFVSFTSLTFDQSVQRADAVVTVRVDGIHDTELPTVDRSNYIYQDPPDKVRDEQSNQILDSLPIHTTYSGKVESWIKGSGDSALLVRGIGGVSSFTGMSSYPDGYFLLEPGRMYLLLLYVDSVDGHYFYGSAREAFDLTDGVKVLNHPITRDLEHFEDMSVDDFVSYVRQLGKAGEASPQPAR
jgi:hypothetical protein